MTIRTTVLLLAAFAALLGPARGAAAQKATELYIPIGRSPGLSGKHTVMGRIATVSTRDHAVTVTGPDGRCAAEFDEHTTVYLDRSSVKRRNTYGDYGDCKPGEYCEIKYEHNDPGTPDAPGRIEWIKIRREGRGAGRAG